MAEHQHSASPDADQHGNVTAGLARSQAAEHSSGRPRLSGGIAAWGDGQRMIAVTTERLATGGGSAESSGYLPTVPPDSEEPAMD